MKKRTIGATIAAVLVATGIAGGVALAGGGEGDGNVTGPEADRAVAAALAETGGTKANAVERDSEKGAVWEVEVAKSDGSTVDVRLDANMHVIAVEPDSDSNEANIESDN
jgi:Peptidase propeptide and YPEB domain